jgi:hypothetical protein
MKIQYASDLHLEFQANTRYLQNNPIIPVGDIFVLAGDTGYLNDDSYSLHPFWDWASENFRETLVIPGNHEFYKSEDLGTLKPGCIASIRPNVKCYYNSVISIEDVDFIMTPLWAKISPENAFITERNVSDFYRIAYNGRPLNAYLFNQEHKKAVQFIRKSILSSKSKQVVVTHHVPTALCMAEEFKNSRINGAFVAELHDFIFDNNINCWIYGHSHRNMPEIDINGTKLLCNQLGYVEHNEYMSFNPKACFEI